MRKIRVLHDVKEKKFHSLTCVYMFLSAIVGGEIEFRDLSDDLPVTATDPGYTSRKGSAVGTRGWTKHKMVSVTVSSVTVRGAIRTEQCNIWEHT